MKSIADVETFEKHERHLHVYYREISALSKKRANDAVNKFKLGLINNSLRELNKIIGLPLEGFDVFDENLLPTNSDAALVLAQYVSAVYEYRRLNSTQKVNDWFWVVNGKISSVKTRQFTYFAYKE